jgi:hypothetical protein
LGKLRSEAGSVFGSWSGIVSGAGKRSWSCTGAGNEFVVGADPEVGLFLRLWLVMGLTQGLGLEIFL